MQILLIRHGESEDDFLEENYNGTTDLPLTPNGRIQVEKMAQRVLNEFPPDFIWSSTLKRARETAEKLTNMIGCPVEYIDQLREQQESESNLEFRLRGERVLSIIKENSSEYTRVAVVTHGGMITKMIESFLELPKENNKWFHTNNTGIHFLDYYKGLQIIRFANSTSHLD
ncbi:2,3-bisphosphoglycerate-dependent phosphoglycerate mutase [Bacillus sp. SLBN-46]|uniref:histidine phosphatase family protein n=1 Tax=Bacillus sp. SLBN-46 TaxID=3042283 RepID=UPI002864DC8E|nr:histidine phosphatase family protein [Bacillus sp. SLBN-46]MDR6121102.1 2,3-bisphosphoglycerate-dependent phosphoglycerate mutase [Bacillus sp. SLBN-46]